MVTVADESIRETRMGARAVEMVVEKGKGKGKGKRETSLLVQRLRTPRTPMERSGVLRI